MDDSLSRESSFDSISTYDGDVLVDNEIPTNSQFNEKNVIDLIKSICCNKRKTT
jgi:hypothetical protein